VSTLALGAALSQLGVQLSPEVTSDILLQSYVDGETQVRGVTKTMNTCNSGLVILMCFTCAPILHYWSICICISLYVYIHTSPHSSIQALWGTGRGGGQQLVDYHTFLSLFLARTQTSLLTRPGDDQFLAATARAASGTPWLTCGGGGSAAAASGNSASSSAVDVSTGAAVDVTALGLQRFSLVILASAHAGGAVSAAGGGGKGGGGITPMVEGSAAFIDFKSKCERGLEVVVHKIKWPKVASAVHKAVGIAPVALANDGSHNGGSSGGNGLGNMSGSGANHTGVRLHMYQALFLLYLYVRGR